MASSPKVLIRAARAADIDRLLVIENRSFRQHRFRKSDFEHHLRNESSILLVAEATEEVIGYIAGIIYHGVRHRIGKLYSMAVLSNWRRKHVGSLLLRSFEKETHRRRAQSVTLEVRKSNRSAKAFYFDLGYGIDADLKDYYSPNSDGLRMRKVLRRDDNKS